MVLKCSMVELATFSYPTFLAYRSPEISSLDQRGSVNLGCTVQVSGRGNNDCILPGSEVDVVDTSTRSSSVQ